MRWLRLARDDVVESRRDRSLWAVVILFVILGGLAGWFLGEAAKEGLPGILSFPILTILLMGVLVPLVAVGISYDSIVGKRSLGSLHLLLGLPYVRRDVVIGAYVGRTVVTMISVLVGVVAISLVSTLIGGSRALPGPVDLVIVLLLVTILTITFVGIGLTFSMATRSSTIAATGVFLTVVALLFLWASVLIPILEILARRIGVSGPNPEWATFLNAINPYHAYQALAATQFIDVGGMGEALISGETFYETPPFAALVMVFWSVVVPALGFQSFNNSDL